MKQREGDPSLPNGKIKPMHTKDMLQPPDVSKVLEETRKAQEVKELPDCHNGSEANAECDAGGTCGIFCGCPRNKAKRERGK